MSRRRLAAEALALDVAAFDGAVGSSGLLTAARLAEAAGCGVSTVYAVRAGYVPSDDLQKRIATALAVSPGELWRKVNRG